jgi:hypothetical protein
MTAGVSIAQDHGVGHILQQFARARVHPLGVLEGGADDVRRQYQQEQRPDLLSRRLFLPWSSTAG